MPVDQSRQERWFHPLIAPANGTINRRRLLVLAGSGTAAVASFRPELQLVAAQTPEASPVADDGPSGDPDAVELLRDAARTMAGLDTFAFEIETVQGETTILEGLTIETIEGAVRRPVDFTATVSVGVPFGTLDVTAVGIDGSAWIQNPLMPDEWIELEGSEEVVALINPDALILASIDVIEGATIEDREQVDGVQTTRVAGQIDFERSAQQLGADATELPTEITDEPLPVLVWIDDHNRILEIELDGPILTTESANVVRVIRFFDFNEPIDIEAPAT